MKFKVRIDLSYIDIEGREAIINYENFDFIPSEFDVEFEIEIENREWGIKDISLYPTRINGSIFLTDLNTNEEEEIVCDNFKIVSDFEDKVPMTVRALEVNLKDKIIYVS